MISSTIPPFLCVCACTLALPSVVCVHARWPSLPLCTAPHGPHPPAYPPDTRAPTYAAGEPAFYRKEIHFFDDDLRYARGLSFYSDHFPRCERLTEDSLATHGAAAAAAAAGAAATAASDAARARTLLGDGRGDGGVGGTAAIEVARSAAAAASAARYWTTPPMHPVEVLLEDVASGEIVGWDAELNIPGDVARTIMLFPARRRGERSEWYWVVDSSSSQLLYNREWLLRPAPLTHAEQTPSRRLALVPVSPNVAPSSPSQSAAAVVGASNTSFWLLDAATSRMLYWRDDVIRVRPFERDPALAWRLHRLSDEPCPHWASANYRLRQSDERWAVCAGMHTARRACHVDGAPCP